jgi:citronellol/citronellal dehydrogenase
VVSMNPQGTLRGKTALVTGASRGIGAAIALRLGREGARVVASARTAEDGESRLSGTLHETVSTIEAIGGTSRFVKADLAIAADRERLVEEAVAAYGPIDILVNNAAVSYMVPFLDYTDKRFGLMLEVQVHAPFHLCQLVVPSMKARRQGWIVNISSGAAFHPTLESRRKQGVVYGMCKAALERFSTGLASELYDDNIAVNVISPGLVETPGTLLHNLVNDETRSRAEPIEYIAESVYELARGDPAVMSGRIDHATPFVEAFGLKPLELS